MIPDNTPEDVKVLFDLILKSIFAVDIEIKVESKVCWLKIRSGPAADAIVCFTKGVFGVVISTGRVVTSAKADFFAEIIREDISSQLNSHSEWAPLAFFDGETNERI